MELYDKIADHFIWRDVVHSMKGERAGINNTPPDSLFSAILATAKKMDMVRTKILRDIIVDSWYRNVEVNHLVGGSFHSQHMQGIAVDWVSPQYGPPVQIVRALIPHIEELNIDQIILEYTWVHTSFGVIPDSKPRGVVLTLLANGTYTQGITDLKGNHLT